MIALDLFSGLGGWSNGFALMGFYVLGIEIEIPIVAQYEHDCIIADCRHLPLRPIKWDVIVGSPPCRDFSQTTSFGKYYWKIPPDPEGKGMELVNAFLAAVKEFKPRFWVLENVPGLKKYLKLKPRMETKLGKTMKRCFWGNFPAFFMIRDYGTKRAKHDIQGPFRKWKRAKIPLPTSTAFAKAIKNALEGEEA